MDDEAANQKRIKDLPPGEHILVLFNRRTSRETEIQVGEVVESDLGKHFVAGRRSFGEGTIVVKELEGEL